MYLSEIDGHTASVARTDADFAAVYALRYDVYIAEQAKSYASADHDRRVFRDDADEWPGATIVVRDARGVASATVRCTYLSGDEAYAAYAGIFALDAFRNWDRNQLVVCSRLAVAAAYRRTSAARVAFEAIYRHELARGVLMCFQYCAPRLRELFRHFGFREYLPPTADPALGRAHRMVLLLDDIANLERSRSPFFSIAQRSQVVSVTRTWFEQNFREPPDESSHATR